MVFKRRQPPGGFSRFELMICLLVMLVLLGVLLMRVLRYQAEAERVAASYTVAAIRLQLPLRKHQLTDELGVREAAQRMANENPMEWLAQKPPNYLGEYYAPNLKKIPHGNWLFDRRDKCLIYLFRRHDSFSFASPTLLKFKVKSGNASSPADGLERQKLLEDVAFVQLQDS